MIFLKRFFDYSIFVLAILLAFLLAFEKYLVIPHFFGWIGHWHPLILHFPIVLIFVTIIQYWRKDGYVEWYLNVTTFASLLTAITGFLLSIESGSKGNTTIIHQWLGVAVAYLITLWYWFSSNNFSSKIIYLTLQSALTIVIVITGHYGGMITHGEDFLSLGREEREEIAVLPDDPNIYQYFIQPVLEQKCMSCHNENKAKGKLNLSSFSLMLQGGASGEIIDRDQLDKSILLQRILLPIEHEDHMPPKDEKQLSEGELTILQDWIKSGANDQIQLSDLDEEDQSHRLIQESIAESRDFQWEDLPGVSDDKINDLKSNYITISRLFSQSNALQVIVYPSNDFGAGELKLLKPIAVNIIELNLRGLELNQKDIQVINSMHNLEKLNLSESNVNDGLFNEYAELPGLRELLVNNTLLTDAILGKMASFPALEKIFAHQTKMNHEALIKFGEQNGIFVIDESPETADFMSLLPVPSIENGRNFFRRPFKLALQHPLKEIDIYYSLSDGHSLSSFQKYTDSILIDTDVKLKFYAEKEGWESSPMDSINIFRSFLIPDHYELLHASNAKYPGRGTKLLFDLEKGPDNFADSAWMAFREDPFILNCSWDEEVTLQSVLVSTIIHTDPYLFPPQSIIVKGGISKNNVRVLAEVKPINLRERKERYFDYFNVSFEPSEIKFLQIEVVPLQSLPIWHQGKGQKGWVFIDEIVLSGTEVL